MLLTTILGSWSSFLRDTHLETSSEAGVPSVSALSPRDVGHLGGVDVWENAGLAARAHAAEHLDGVVSHAEVRVDPVVPYNELHFDAVMQNATLLMRHFT